ncbi:MULTISPECIES: hypothetical protein [unclassified Aureimonas]|nr:MULTISPECIES: hypothetical protein [unclassified Aureimonas]
MLSDAKAKDGIKGMVRAIPAVGRHLMANPPKLKDDDASAQQREA